VQVHQAPTPHRRPDSESARRNQGDLPHGHGSIRLRGTWDIGPETRSTKTIYVDSVPYTVNKSQLIERIAEVVMSRSCRSCST